MTTDRMVRVVGVSFVQPGYPQNLLTLRDLIDANTTPEPLAAILIRNPDNPHDANAVEVHAPTVGMVGHIPRDVAAQLAPMLDGGVRVAASVEAVWVKDGHEDRPGVDVRLSAVDDPDRPAPVATESEPF